MVIFFELGPLFLDLFQPVMTGQSCILKACYTLFLVVLLDAVVVGVDVFYELDLCVPVFLITLGEMIVLCCNPLNMYFNISVYTLLSHPLPIHKPILTEKRPKFCKITR